MLGIGGGVIKEVQSVVGSPQSVGMENGERRTEQAYGDGLRKVYDFMSQSFDVGTMDEFAAAMEDSARRRKVYDYLGQQFDVGAFDDFSRRVVGDGQAAGGRRRKDEADIGWWERMRRERSEMAARMKESELGNVERPGVGQVAGTVLGKIIGVKPIAPTDQPTEEVRSFHETPLIKVSKVLPEEVDDFSLDAIFKKTPMKDLPMPAKRAVYGAMRGTTQFIEGMTSPAMIGLLAATGALGRAAQTGGPGLKALSAAVSAGFAADMGINAARDTKRVVEAVKQGDYQRAGEALAMTALGGAFAIGAGKHAYKTGRWAYSDMKGVPESKVGEVKKINAKAEEKIKEKLGGAERRFTETAAEKEARIRRELEQRRSERARKQEAAQKASDEVARMQEEQRAGMKIDWRQEADAMINELEGATLDRGEAWSVSTAPKWFRNLQPGGRGKERLRSGVVNKKDVLAVLKKVREGKELTDRQEGIWEAVKGEYERVIVEKGVGSGEIETGRAGALQQIESEVGSDYVDLVNKYGKKNVDELIQNEAVVVRRENGKVRIYPKQKQSVTVSDWDQYVAETGEVPFRKVKVGERSEYVDGRVIDEAKRKAEKPQALGAETGEGKMSIEPAGADTRIGRTKEPISRAAIRQYIDKEFDVPIRKGSLGGGRRKSVRGQYSSGEEVILEKIYGDIGTEIHELGHHLDKTLGITNKLKNFPRRYTEELGKLDYDYPNKKRINEGFAEFVRHDLMIGDAKQQAPGFYEHWQLQLDKDAALRQRYEKLREMVRRYHEQGADERVWSQIDMKGKPDKVPIAERGKWIWHKIVGDWQDSLKPIDRIVTEARKARARKEGRPYKPLPITEDPFAMATYLKGTSRIKAESWVFEGTKDVFGRKTGKGLEEILKPVRGEMKDFIKYVVSRRALILAERDIYTGIALKDAEYIFKKYDSKKFRKAADEMMDWSDRALSYLEDAGGINAEQHAHIRLLNPFYVALKRYFGDEKRSVHGSSGQQGKAGKTIYGIHGGGEKIINPIEGMVGEVHRLILAADRIRVMRALSDLQELEGMGRLIRRVDPPMEAREVKLKDLKPQLEELGLEGAELDKTLTMFMPTWEYRGKNNIISVWKDGKRKFYEVDKRLYDALQGMETRRLHPYLDFVFGKPARMIRLMTTGLNAGFGLIRNPFRDLMTTIAYTKGKAATAPFRSISGVVKDIKGDPMARRFIELGGEMATLMGQDRAATMRAVDKIMLDRGSLKGKALYVARHPIDAARRLVQIPEMGPRIGEFETVLKKHFENWKKKSGETSWEKFEKSPEYETAIVDAFNAARDLTVNFSRNGTYGAIINQIIPFWNASLQSGEKMVRMARQHPLKFAARGMSAITVPTFILWAINKDKQWYKDLPLSYKYNNWFIQIDDDTIIRLPKPFELGTVFGAFLEGVLDQNEGIDDDAVSEAAALLIKNLNPGFLPGAVQPIYQLWRNKDWLGRRIETKSMERMEKPERTRQYTSELAKIMSQGMYKMMPEGWVLSPVQIDHLLNGYTGGLYRNVMGVGRERQQKSDIPVVGTLFLREGQGPRREVNWIYETGARLDRAWNTLQKYRKSGDRAGYEGVLARNPELRRYKKLNRMKKEVTELLKLRRARPDKAEAIDEQIRRRYEIMRNILEVLME